MWAIASARAPAPSSHGVQGAACTISDCSRALLVSAAHWTLCPFGTTHLVIGAKLYVVRVARRMAAASSSAFTLGAMLVVRARFQPRSNTDAAMECPPAALPLSRVTINNYPISLMISRNPFSCIAPLPLPCWRWARTACSEVTGPKASNHRHCRPALERAGEQASTNHFVQ